MTKLLAVDAGTGNYNAIIETPRGSRNKFKFNEKHGVFALSSVLPAGAVFPFDFGFLPSTRGEDGDPLDVLVLLDESTAMGCLVPVRLVGVIEAEQTEQGKTKRNDRLISVAAASHLYKDIQSLEDLSAGVVGEVEHFFISYNEFRGRQFKPVGRHGPGRARELVDKARQC